MPQKPTFPQYARAALTAAATVLLPAVASASSVTTSSATVLCTSASVYATFTDNTTAAFNRCVGPLWGNLTSNPSNISATESTILGQLGLDVDYVGLSNLTGFGPFGSDPGTPTGTLVLDQVMYGSFVLGLHGPKPTGGLDTVYTLYAFDNPNHLGVTSLHFDMAGTSVKNGGAQNLSHAALYASTYLPTNPPTSPPLPQTDSQVPEPSALLLALAALGALNLTRLRRR